MASGSARPGVKMKPLEFIDVRTEDHIVWITLNRPAQANAIHEKMWEEIGSAFRQFDQDDEARVIVLSGAGKYFSAGIDFGFVGSLLAEVSAHPEGRKQEALREKIIKLQSAFSAVEKCRKPVIAMVHGACVGAGLDLIAACDLRFACDGAHFCLKEIDLGLVADVGSLQRLPQIVGEGKVREWAFTAKKVLPKEAEGCQLLNAVFPDEDALREGVTEMAETIAEKSPLAMRGVKAVMNYSRDHSIADGLDYVATWNAGMLLSEEGHEAVAAMMERRKANFA